MSTTETDAPTERKLKKRKRIKLRTSEPPTGREELDGPRPVVIQHTLPVPERVPNVPMRVITVEPAKTTIRPKDKTKRYWVGVTQDAPFDNKSFGGTSFQRWSGTIEADPTTGELNISRAAPGGVVDLTDSQVQTICEAIARRVVRTVGDRKDATGNYRCDTLTATAPGFRPEQGDLPVGRYLYMVEINEMMPPDWRSSQPMTMVTRN